MTRLPLARTGAAVAFVICLGLVNVATPGAKTKPRHRHGCGAACNQAGPTGDPPLKAKRRHHPGCGAYCQQAGPPAGPPTEGPDPVRLFDRVLHIRGGAVRIDVKCILKKRCVGAIGVWDAELTHPGNDFGKLGAVNMSIPTGNRTRVTVPLSSKSLALIRRRRSRSVEATIIAFEKGHCSGPKDCDTAGMGSRAVRVTLS